MNGHISIAERKKILEEYGLLHDSLCGPTMSDKGEVLWGQATMRGGRWGFSILNVRRGASIVPVLAFSKAAVYQRLGKMKPGEVESISHVHPQAADKTKWAARGLLAVWLFKPDDDEMAYLSFEFDSGGRDYFPQEKGAWTVLWRRS